jgi:hypothetical protein
MRVRFGLTQALLVVLLVALLLILGHALTRPDRCPDLQVFHSTITEEPAS